MEMQNQLRTALDKAQYYQKLLEEAVEEGRAGLAAYCDFVGVTFSEKWSLIRERMSVTVQALYRCLEGAWQRIKQFGEAKGRVVRFLFLYTVVGYCACKIRPDRVEFAW